jgi:hypothetical protein
MQCDEKMSETPEREYIDLYRDMYPIRRFEARAFPQSERFADISRIKWRSIDVGNKSENAFPVK